MNEFDKVRLTNIENQQLVLHFQTETVEYFQVKIHTL